MNNMKTFSPFHETVEDKSNKSSFKNVSQWSCLSNIPIVRPVCSECSTASAPCPPLAPSIWCKAPAGTHREAPWAFWMNYPNTTECLNRPEYAVGQPSHGFTLQGVIGYCFVINVFCQKRREAAHGNTPLSLCAQSR